MVRGAAALAAGLLISVMRNRSIPSRNRYIVVEPASPLPSPAGTSTSLSRSALTAARVAASVQSKPLGKVMMDTYQLTNCSGISVALAGMGMPIAAKKVSGGIDGSSSSIKSKR